MAKQCFGSKVKKNISKENRGLIKIFANF